MVGRLALALIAAALCVSACGRVAGLACAGVGYYAVHVTIRDQSGHAQALGATVNLYDGSYHEVDRAGTDPGSSDTLNVWGAEERGGRIYDIQVTKPYYNDVWVRGVPAPGGGCVTEASAATVTVPVVLTLAPGAPPIRSLYVLPRQVLLDRPPYRGTVTFTAFIDADPGVSRAVRWLIRGDTASVTFDALTGTAVYICRPTSGYLTVTAVSAVNPALADSAALAVQGHPAMTSDPPCN